MTESSYARRRRYSSTSACGSSPSRFDRSSSRRSSPAVAISRSFPSAVTPGGRAISGILFTPSSIFTLHRSAIASVFARASGAACPNARSNSSAVFT